MSSLIERARTAAQQEQLAAEAARQQALQASRADRLARLKHQIASRLEVDVDCLPADQVQLDWGLKLQTARDVHRFSNCEPTLTIDGLRFSLISAPGCRDGLQFWPTCQYCNTTTSPTPINNLATLGRFLDHPGFLSCAAATGYQCQAQRCHQAG